MGLLMCRLAFKSSCLCGCEPRMLKWEGVTFTHSYLTKMKTPFPTYTSTEAVSPGKGEKQAYSYGLNKI